MIECFVTDGLSFHPEERISYSYHAPRSAEPMHSEELGGMTLLEASVELTTPYEAGGRKHTFEIVSPKHRDDRRLMLSFRSASELEEWKKAIECAVKDSGDKGGNPEGENIVLGEAAQEGQRPLGKSTGLMTRAEAMLHHRKSRASELANAAARRRSNTQRQRGDSLKLRKNSTMMESLRSLVVPGAKKTTTMCRRCSKDIDLDESLKW